MWERMGKFTRFHAAYAYTDAEGFQGALYEAGDKMVVALRGTASWEGVKADLNIVFRRLPKQAVSAHKLLEAALSLRSLSEIVVTGHSLGGGLTQMVCAATGAMGVTFNAVGVGIQAAKQQEGFHASNILNIVLKSDPVSSWGTLIGKKLQLPNPNGFFDTLKLKAHSQDSVVRAVELSDYKDRTPQEVMRSISAAA